MKAILLPLIVVLCSNASVGLAQITSGEWTYTLNDANEATITRYSGPGGAVEIPSVLDGNPVKQVGSGWPPIFASWNTTVTSVVIPDSVTSIGAYAFSRCTSLTSVTIGSGVTSIGENAFSYCTSLASVVIPDSVTSIGSGVFAGCSSLTSMVIPDSVTSIGDRAFLDCTGLTTVVIPDSVTSIREGAFSRCTSLTTVVIPDSVTSIGDRAFLDCTGLTTVVIPDSVTSIGEYAFGRCTSLTSVVIPDSVTSIGDGAFSSCTSLTSMVIPDSVTSIGDGAFYSCSSLTSVVIPDGVTSIGGGVFAGCSSLETISIPASVVSIGFGMYYHANAERDAESFEGCLALQDIDIDPENPAYASIDGVVFNKTLTTLFRVPPGKQGPYAVPGTVAVINDWAFHQCAGLTVITIPVTVVSAGSLNFGAIYDEWGEFVELANVPPIEADVTALATNEAFVDALAAKIVAALPDNYGIATKADLSGAIADATSQAISQVQASPNDYNLYSSSQYEANRIAGVAEGKAEVTGNPSAFNLYTSDSIMDLRMNGAMVQKHGDAATVVFQPQITTDLATEPFVNHGTPITNTIPMPGDKGFLRIQAR